MILRSLLFVPGNSMRMIIKAATLPPDAIILDLEDAVPLPDKVTARIMIRDSVAALKSAGADIFVRLNCLATKLTDADLDAVVVKGLDGVILAKSESKADMTQLEHKLDVLEKARGLEPGKIKIIPLLETAKGVVNAYEIASASGRIVATAFGSGDYYRDLGRSVANLSPDQNELLYARSQIVNCSRAAGLPAIDTPFFGLLTDKEGFVREIQMALRLGFKGKLLIHPNQIDLVNKYFSPSIDEVEYARKVVAAFEEALARGLGAVSFEGRMIDYMNYNQAKSLVEFAQTVAEKEAMRQKSPPISLSRFFIPTV